MDAVIVENISYSYGDIKAVDNISFRIPEGHILGFLGPNGAGKTTTLKMLIGLLKPQSGKITILGMDAAKEVEKYQARIGVCFEEKNLYEDMSAQENLKFFASLYGIKKPPVDELLERVGLAANRKDRVGNFSKGMKQRLMIARALVNKPDVLFLDEPTDGLDPVSAEIIRNVILEEKARGVAVFLTTHDMHEADRLSDTVAFINEGKIVAMDTPDNLKHEYGKRQVAVRYRIDGEIKEELLDLDDKATPERMKEILEKYEVRDLHTREATLEDIFIHFTGRGLE